MLILSAPLFSKVPKAGFHDTAHTESSVVDLSALWPTRPQD